MPLGRHTEGDGKTSVIVPLLGAKIVQNVHLKVAVLTLDPFRYKGTVSGDGTEVTVIQLGRAPISGGTVHCQTVKLARGIVLQAAYEALPTPPYPGPVPTQDPR